MMICYKDRDRDILVERERERERVSSKPEVGRPQNTINSMAVFNGVSQTVSVVHHKLHNPTPVVFSDKIGPMSFKLLQLFFFFTFNPGHNEWQWNADRLQITLDIQIQMYLPSIIIIVIIMMLIIIIIKNNKTKTNYFLIKNIQKKKKEEEIK